jgi:hypothetical protein
LNFNLFALFILLFVSASCGVKNDPIPPAGSKPLIQSHLKYLKSKPIPKDIESEESSDKQDSEKNIDE